MIDIISAQNNLNQTRPAFSSSPDQELMKPRKTFEQGFSIIELMIVIGVIAIIAAFSFLAVQSTMRLRRVDSAVSLIVSKLSEARSNAIKRNSVVRLLIAPSNRSFQVFHSTTAIGFPEYLPRDVNFAGTPPAEISFDSMGRLTTTAQTVSVAAAGGGGTKALTVSPAGKVTIQSMTY